MVSLAAKIIDGKKLSDKILENVKKEVSELKKQGIVPGLTVVQVGHNSASDVYVGKKQKACKDVGINSKIINLDDNVSYENLVDVINDLNHDDSVHGILVQLPLPKEFKKKRIMELIDKRKDVDGFHPYNHGKYLLKEPVFVPATAMGIVALVESTGEEIEGKCAVIVGTSSIAGKPAALMLLNKHVTVTMCNKYTKDLAHHTKHADILVVATGVIGLIKKDMVKPGAIVIDVGINRNRDGKLVGDVDFENVKKVAGWITPVPGGSGPMTVACLMENTIEAAKRLSKIE